MKCTDGIYLSRCCCCFFVVVVVVVVFLLLSVVRRVLAYFSITCTTTASVKTNCSAYIYLKFICLGTWLPSLD